MDSCLSCLNIYDKKVPTLQSRLGVLDESEVAQGTSGINSVCF